MFIPIIVGIVFVVAIAIAYSSYKKKHKSSVRLLPADRGAACSKV